MDTRAVHRSPRTGSAASLAQRSTRRARSGGSSRRDRSRGGRQIFETERASGHRRRDRLRRRPCIIADAPMTTGGPGSGSPRIPTVPGLHARTGIKLSGADTDGEKPGLLRSSAVPSNSKSRPRGNPRTGRSAGDCRAAEFPPAATKSELAQPVRARPRPRRSRPPPRKKPVAKATGVVTSRREPHGSQAWMDIRAWSVNRSSFILSRWCKRSQVRGSFGPGRCVLRDSTPSGRSAFPFCRHQSIGGAMGNWQIYPPTVGAAHRPRSRWLPPVALQPAQARNPAGDWRSFSRAECACAQGR